MKKFLIGLVAGFVLAGLAGVIAVFAVARMTDRQPSIPPSAALIFRLEGEVPELAPLEIPLPLLESQSPVTVLDTWDLLRKAGSDARIKAVLFQPRGVGAGWAKLDQIRSSLVQFKRSGKPLYAFLHNPGAKEYYLATAADKIFLTREDLLDLKGLRAEATFYRRTLDKIGVQMEVEYAGKYKNAADAFLRTSMTPESREVLNSVLDQIYGHLVETVAQSRKRTPEQVRALIDDGPFLAEQAKAKGLVDGLLYEDEVMKDLKERLKGQELATLSHRDYLKIPALSLGLEGRERVAIVIGEGAITRGGGGGNSFGGDEGIRSGPFIKMLRQVADDATIRGVILRVNSPGGDAIASDDILHEVRRLSKRKPVVISMSDLAASGGYFISMSGDPVLAYPNTFTGSIGVIYGKVNLAGLYEKLGLNVEILTRGRHADIDSASRPLSEDGRKKLREGVDFVYRSFLERVAEGRRRKVEEVEPLAQGRLWLGLQAKGNGLVDELGGLDRAIEMIRKRAGIKDDEKIRLVRYPAKKTLFELLFSESSESSLEAMVESAGRSALRLKLRALSAQLGLAPEQAPFFPMQGILRIAPYTVKVF
ncbi:MAG: signal peptide peptidase SppA [Acidobacteriia bacterium]|nr:signal peptide peptidase SppA [Terriglobia bacterium]